MRSLWQKPIRIGFIGAALCGFLLGCQSSSPVGGDPDDERAALRAAFIESVQREAGPQYHAQAAVQGEGLRFVHGPQQWQAHLDQSGLELQPASGAWRFAMELVPPACGSAMGKPMPQAERNQASFPRGAVTEWYLNGPLGLEQGFTVTENPCPGEPLRIELQLGGNLKAQAGSNGLVLRDAQGKTALRYTDLYAKDATGRRMRSQLELDESRQRVSLLIQDAAGQYPITIDPLMWTEKQKIVAGDAMPTDQFGASIAVDKETAAIGAYNVDTMGDNAGAVYIFTHTSGTWTQQDKILPPAGSAGANFGYAVALRDNTLIVGAPQSTTGAANGIVYVYTLMNNAWVQQQTLTADPTKQEFFGIGIALSGDTLFISAPFTEVDGLTYAGAVYRFERAAGAFGAAEQRILSSRPKFNDRFGASMAFDGQSLAVGALGWVNGAGTAEGSVSVFVRNGRSFMPEQLITDGIVKSQNRFGDAVAIEGDTLVVGAPEADLVTIAKAGKAHVFTRRGSTWSERQQINAATPTSFATCGRTVSLSGDNLVIGCPTATAAGRASAGNAEIFRRTEGSWSWQQQLTASDATSDVQFGSPVYFSGTTIFAGAAAWNPDSPTNPGSVYVFELVQNNGALCAVNTECSSGYCVDGVCCDKACGGTTMGDCQACAVATGASADGTCSVIPAAAEYSCRVNRGPCDLTENCDGTSPECPMDAHYTPGTVCRSATGICDITDTCDGVTDDCIDQKKNGTVCRVSGGPCDPAEVCNGVMNTCPEDQLAGPNVQCRAAGANATCDPADFCDGTRKLCPARFSPVGMQCTGGRCTGTGLCR